jgi:hypothetical protein
MRQAPSTLSHSAKQSKLARALPFPKPKPKLRPQKASRRIGRAVLQSAMRDRLRAYRGDDPAAFEWRAWAVRG